MASCAACCASAPRSKRAATRAQVVLVPESAHGTNPATAAFAGYRVENIPANAGGPRRSRRAQGPARPGRRGGDDHQPQHLRPVRAGHEGDLATRSMPPARFVYCDGANFNAIVGKVRPGDLGIDAMHINLHKTFSTPHGGGGPGSGPVVLSEALAPFAPLPFAAQVSGRHASSWSRKRLRARSIRRAFGRMVAFHGQMGMFTRALDLHPQPRRRRPEAGRRGRGAQRQLHPAQPRGRARRAVRDERPVHARGDLHRQRLRRAASARSISPRR